MRVPQRSQARRQNSEARLHVSSYRPTGSTSIDRVLDAIDALTGGRAGWVQRLVLYLAVGGFAAGINLLCFALVYYGPEWRIVPSNPGSRYPIAFTVATEVSILASFIPNDRFTFRYLPGHERAWLGRCARFHVTGIAGNIVTLVISLTLVLLGVAAVVAQAIALVIATAFNFALHHIFTYRPVPGTGAQR